MATAVGVTAAGSVSGEPLFVRREAGADSDAELKLLTVSSLVAAVSVFPAD